MCISASHCTAPHEHLARASHWFEVVWGIPYTLHVFYLAAGDFHPSQSDADGELRASHPDLVSALDADLPGRWRFVCRDAGYFNEAQTAFHEWLFLFDAREDGVRFVEAHAHAVVQSRLAHWDAKTEEARQARRNAVRRARVAPLRARDEHQTNVRKALAVHHYYLAFGVDDGYREPAPPTIPEARISTWEAESFAAERQAAEQLLALPPAELLPVLLRETPPLFSNREKWYQGGRWHRRNEGSLYQTSIEHTEASPRRPVVVRKDQGGGSHV